MPGPQPARRDGSRVFEADPAADKLRRQGSHIQLLRCIARLMAVCSLLAPAVRGEAESPTPAALAAFDRYVVAAESRLAHQHSSPDGFLVGAASASSQDSRLRGGERIVEQIAPANETSTPGAMLHHWRATGFVSGATAAGFVRLMKDVSDYPKRFAPEVVRATVSAPANAGNGDHINASMRVRQKHVITVVMDTDYDIVFGSLDPKHGYSISRSTSISEIAAAGTPGEHRLSAAEEHGFLWRQNIYWSFEERDGGLYLQVESISLTRAIPTGLGWALKPFVESVPRESLEFTLRCVSDALRAKPEQAAR